MLLSYGKQFMQNTKFTYFNIMFIRLFSIESKSNLCAKFKMNYNFVEDLIAKVIYLNSLNSLQF